MTALEPDRGHPEHVTVLRAAESAGVGLRVVVVQSNYTGVKVKPRYSNVQWCGLANH
jgi:hypothetical protein